MLHDASPHARGLSPRWWALAAIAAMLVIPMRPTAAAAAADPTAQRITRESSNPRNPTSPSATKRHDDTGESWVFLQDDENTMTHGSSSNLADAKRLRANASEPLIWFKRDGRAYVIRDRETLDKARALFIPQERAAQGDARARRASDNPGAHAGRAGRAHRRRCARQLRALDEKVNEAAAAVQKTVAPPPHPSEDARRRVREELRSREDRLHEAEASRRDADGASGGARHAAARARRATGGARRRTGRARPPTRRVGPRDRMGDAHAVRQRARRRHRHARQVGRGRPHRGASASAPHSTRRRRISFVGRNPMPA